MSRVVFLIGPPCSGKSTLIKEWERRGGVVLGEFLEPVPEFVHNSWLGSEEEQVAAQKWAVDQHRRKDDILQSLDTNEPILVERSPLDVVAYGRVFGGDVARQTEAEVLKRRWTPGALILLETDEDALKQRWVTGRGLPPADWDNQWEPFSVELQKQYDTLRRSFGVPVINTETSVDDSMERLHALVERCPTYQIESLIGLRGNTEKE